MQEKIEIFIEDTKEKGLIPSVTHRLYKRKILKHIFLPFLKKLRPSAVTVGGVKLYLDPDDLVVSESLGFGKRWSPMETEIIKSNLKEGDTFVDVGAHIGYFTLIAARLVGPHGHVYSFEPNPRSFNILQKNIKANNLENVTAINKAVTNKTSSTYLYLNMQNTGDTRITNPNRETNKVKVKTTTLNKELKNKSIDFIKIDVQGAEPLVLNGGKKILDKNNKMKMLIEFWPKGIKKIKYNEIEFFKTLKSTFKTVETTNNLRVDKYSILKKVLTNSSEVNLFCHN